MPSAHTASRVPSAAALWREHLASLSESRGRARRRFVAAALFAAALLAGYAESRAVGQVATRHDPGRRELVRALSYAPPAPGGAPYRAY